MPESEGQFGGGGAVIETPVRALPQRWQRCDHFRPGNSSAHAGLVAPSPKARKSITEMTLPWAFNGFASLAPRTRQLRGVLPEAPQRLPLWMVIAAINSTAKYFL